MQTDELARVRAFIAEHQWHFAKTMPMIPHRYSVNLVNNRELFLPLHQDSSKGNSLEGMTTLPIHLVRASFKSRYLTAFVFRWKSSFAPFHGFRKGCR